VTYRIRSPSRRRGVSTTFFQQFVHARPARNVEPLSEGDDSKAAVGSDRKPTSLVTGWCDFDKRTAALGSRANASEGPVRSSWVSRGKNRSPICVVAPDMLFPCRALRDTAYTNSAL
jgi:hypothetical protein